METLVQTPSQDSAGSEDRRNGQPQQPSPRQSRTLSDGGQQRVMQKAKSEGTMLKTLNGDAPTGTNTIHSNNIQQQQHFVYPVQYAPQFYYGSAPAAAPPPRGPAAGYHTHSQSQSLYGIRSVASDDAHEQQRLLPHGQSNNDARQARRSSRRHNHRKSHSSNAAIMSSKSNNGGGACGAFWGPPSQPPMVIPETAPPPPPPSGGNGALLSSSLPASHRQHAPHHVRRSSWGHQYQHHHQQQQQPMYPPPQSPGSATTSPRIVTAKSFDPRLKEMRSLSSSFRSSPRLSPRVSPVYLPGDLLSATSALLIPNNTTTIQQSPSWSTPSPDSFNNLTNTSHTKRKESLRRKHMRQHSAQLFMESAKGSQQPQGQCRDVLFLVLFVTHLLGVIYLGQLYFQYAIANKHVREDEFSSYDTRNQEGETTTTMMMDGDDDSDNDKETVTIYYNTLLYAACLCGSFAMILSAALLGIMTIFARQVVQVALVVAMTLSFIWGTIGIGLSPRNFVPVTGIIALALSVAYAFVVWDRIPFASVNVLTALTAIRAYPGLSLVALIVQALALGWSIYFCVVVVGVYDAIQQEELVLSHEWKVFLYVCLGMSYYWTFQVLSNTLKACTSSVIEAWWHASTEERVVSKAVYKTSFSLGSICYGSLLVGPVSLIRQVAVLFVRPNPIDDAPLLCFHECLYLVTNCLSTMVEALTRRFTPWAFSFVGLYNYSFADAAYHVTDLFDKRGWTVIVSDDLIPNILLMTSLVLGGMTGCLGHMMEWMDVWQLTSLGEPGLVSFVMGAIIGVVLSSILLGMIHSSVNAVLICFASEPVDFANNHPQLSDEMREAWREVWPGALDIMDMRIAMAHARATPIVAPMSPRSTIQRCPEQAPASFLPPPLAI